MYSLSNRAWLAVTKRRVPPARAVVLAVLAVTMACGCTSTYLGRWIWWNRVVSAEWIDAPVQPEGPCQLTSHGTRVCYQLSWGIHAPDGDWPHAVGGWGHLGQYVYVFPEEKLVMVRLGSEEADVWRRYVFRAVAEELGG